MCERDKRRVGRIVCALLMLCLRRDTRATRFSRAAICLFVGGHGGGTTVCAVAHVLPLSRVSVWLPGARGIWRVATTTRSVCFGLQPVGAHSFFDADYASS